MDWKSLCLFPTQTIGEAMRLIEKLGSQFAVVVDAGGRLLGTLTDGNIRRALLAGADMDTPVTRAMNPSPMTCAVATSAADVLSMLSAHGYSYMPVVDAKGRMENLWSRAELQSCTPLPNAVVLMAGGLGTRLGELTQNCPKPMLTVGDRPLLEIVLENFLRVGFRHFYVSVNYMADMITEYFGNGEKLGCRIEYLRESKRMGTAGALSLLPPQNAPLLVANGDVLTHMNMRLLLIQHIYSGVPATMAAKRVSTQLPFGVVDADENGTLRSIEEKPALTHLVNAGIYALSPDALSEIPDNEFFDMPDLFRKLMKRAPAPKIYPVDDYWLDIGRMDDFKRAQADVKNI